ncbi:potassium transporter [Pseudohalioglobus sediminis]|uniref:Trk system potassium uptake protein n=1 Tax=Pseudohalioglobus sediminis TaxID=2606449 RepID=A0A5B0WW17_9GAMM|nr:TrkH family potassium uptake protein [Pseudohalioglobus sediminis]KAA1190565.1 potassium transporter [Pseudohalioglobus sediminis]
MHISVSLRILGILLMLFSSTMLIPLVTALIAEDNTADGFLSALGITFFSGLAIWVPVMHARHELRIRDGFLITSLFWTVLGLFGSLPFILTESLQLTTTEAIFESISGLTTTGATVIVGLDSLPASILIYRQLLQWMGGIGIIVVAVAVLPMLGIGGMQLYKAETPGPSKDSKLTPRITETAKALATVYITLTAVCALAYWAAGMTPFDAIAHALSTVAIGGFSTHDASMGYFDSNTILMICSLFMYISAINFGLHFIFWRRRNIAPYRKDSETRFFSGVLLICIAITCTYLILSGTLQPSDGVVHGIFQAVSITTTTGFATQDFAHWPSFLPVMLLMFSFMGGCVGSTGGGMKAMRLMLIYKQGVRELKQLVHPNAVIPLKVGRRRVEASVVSAVWSFFAVYTTCFIVIMLLLMATGLDFTTAFSAVAASINNLGPGLGEVAANYASISDTAKGILCFTMLLGRLEVFTLLVLFTPMFWRI